MTEPEPVRVGLVGAGPWAQIFTAPMLAAGPHTTLSGVWARRADVAADLAGRFGAAGFDDLDALIDASDALAFALPPDVQEAPALRAARKGKGLLLDKPVGLSSAAAQRFAGAVGDTGAVSQLVLTNRYIDAVRDFLAGVVQLAPHGGRATFLGGGNIRGGFFATPWRLREGGLVDLGPHVFDALEAALGPIVDVRAAGDPFATIAVTCHHASGAVSQATMSGTVPADPSGLLLEVWGTSGTMSVDATGGGGQEMARRFAGAQVNIASEFAYAVRTGTPHPLDVHRGAYLQRIIQQAADQL
jgi:predicted dehydrogenase